MIICDCCENKLMHTPMSIWGSVDDTRFEVKRHVCKKCWALYKRSGGWSKLEDLAKSANTEIKRIKNRLLLESILCVEKGIKENTK